MNDNVPVKYALLTALATFFIGGLLAIGFKEGEVRDSLQNQSFSTISADGCFDVRPGKTTTPSWRAIMKCVDENATNELDEAESTINDAIDEFNSGNSSSAIKTLESFE